MKRLFVFVVLMACVVGTLVAGPAERFVKVYSMTAAKGADLQIVPTYLGTAFQPNKLSLNMTCESGTDHCTLMVYVPLNTGPDTATDSIPIYLTVRASSGTQWQNYYGPMSDTMRVYNDANVHVVVHAYGW